MPFTRPRAALAALPFLLAACGGGDSYEAAAPKTNTNSTVAESDIVIGSEDAPLTVIEYASVTCGHCAHFHQTILPGIKEKYIDTGKVKLVFREFPTPPEGLSYVGSVLARCAAEKDGPDAYFLVLGTLFKTQKTWIYGEDPKLELVKIAGQAGMDETAFDACMQRQDIVDMINTNVAEGSQRYGVDSTPSFVIGDEKITIRSQEDLEQRLDAALAKAAG